MISFYPALLAHGPGRTGGITPLLGTSNYVLTNTLLGATGLNVVSFAHQPDVVRVLTVTGNASGITGSVVITGKDASGATITDSFTLSGTGTITGAKAFKTVTNVALPTKTHSSGDAVSVGTADIFGLYNKLSSTGLVLIKHFNHETDAGSLAVSASVLAANLFTPAGAPDGSKSIDLYYFVS